MWGVCCATYGGGKSAEDQTMKRDKFADELVEAIREARARMTV